MTAEPSAIAWRPSAEDLERSRLRRFMAAHGIAEYGALLERAAADPAWFWDAVVRDLELEWFTPYAQVMDLSAGVPWARWFTGGTYNYVHNALDRFARNPATAGHTALIWEGEDGATRTLTSGQLDAEVAQAARALRALGIGKGDRVGIFLPMLPETAVAVLACGKIGAVFIPIFSGYAAPAVATRLRDCGARLVVTADGYYRRGSVVPMKEVADAAADDAPTVEHVLVVRRVGRADAPWTATRDVCWHEVLAAQPAECATEALDPEDPYMIIYTSGTTGRPKGAVHVHAGFPLKGAQDMAHCFDVQSDDIVFWFTDMGWMMGPWLLSGALTLGATALFYEGTPDYPAPDRLWSIVERHRATVLGISPTAMRGLMARGAEWVERHDLSSLRALGSTGEPWDPVSWRWTFETVGGGRCPIINYSGGTEISGGIVGCTTITPLKPCCFSGPIPGMDADVVDEQGRPVRGAVGELVIRGPWPGMTRGFWGDAGRYLETYWSRLPGMWVHGDWAEIDEEGFWFIRGRSDDTIKVAGKRLGPAEVESAATAHRAVVEAAAVGVPDEIKGEAVAVFVVLRAGHEPSEELRGEIVETITTALGKALRPRAVLFCTALPKTRNAKIMRRVVRAAHLGQTDLGDLSALENQATVEAIRLAR